MKDITLIIPAKFESESLPIFFKEIKHLNCKKIIILEENDYKTINSIKNFEGIKIHYQKNRGYGSAIIEGIKIWTQRLSYVGELGYELYVESKDAKKIYELLINTPAIGNLIRERKVSQIYSQIQTGSKDGMNTLEQCLSDLVIKGKISKEEAIGKASVPKAILTEAS